MQSPQLIRLKTEHKIYWLNNWLMKFEPFQLLQKGPEYHSWLVKFEPFHLLWKLPECRSYSATPIARAWCRSTKNEWMKSPLFEVKYSIERINESMDEHKQISCRPYFRFGFAPRSLDSFELLHGSRLHLLPGNANVPTPQNKPH